MAVRYILHWGRDNARRITSLTDLDGLLSFLTTVRGHEGAPYGVDLLPAGAATGGLQLGVGHPHRAFAIWLGTGTADLAAELPAAGSDLAAVSGGYGIEDDLEPWPEPIGFDCGVEVVDFKPAWTRVTPGLALRAAREYMLSGTMPTCLRFDPNV
jgi:Immunity protein Imm1